MNKSPAPTPLSRWKRWRLHLTRRSNLPRTRQLFLQEFQLPYVSPTGLQRSILRYGKPFIETFPRRVLNERFEETIGRANFETGVGIGIYAPAREEDTTHGLHHGSPLVQAKIGFTRNEVVVENIQGMRGAIKEIDKLNRLLGEPWPNHLLTQVENHARYCGFSRVALRRPETLHYYKKRMSGETREEHEKRKERMRTLYRKAAEARGFRTEDDFYVKDL